MPWHVSSPTMKRKILSLSFCFLLAACGAYAADLPAPADSAAATPAVSAARHQKKSRKHHHRKHGHRRAARVQAKT